ncbi:hypothetical protein HYALB_00009751 [Hymenoscyphus albidus]|uniref:Glutamate carboxypeptidase n=1 Tax=Hymenoscyphus albidus TaxID=595503 RepID=A0A9N9LJQ4_9HELO|nr:hypothetical protein HYALB_00009751 [Hymenoscyphus albidus]
MRSLILPSLLATFTLACQKESHTDQALGLTAPVNTQYVLLADPVREPRAVFPPTLSDEETLLVNAFDAVDIETWSSYYTHGDHVAGKNKSQAEWTAERWSDFGVPSKLVEYEVYLNYPVSARLELQYGNGSVYRVAMVEDRLVEDETSESEEGIPAFHGYSRNGSAETEYVYVGAGHEDDFKALISLGVPLEGKIALSKYGNIFRGVKVKNAQAHGMVGVVIFTDPGSDGPQAAKGDIPYPDGPARQPSSIQRGSVCDLTLAVGDPTTPGYPSKPGVARTDGGAVLPKIPSLPISFRDAIPLLAALDGFGVSGANVSSSRGTWLGGLNVSYSTGPNPAATLSMENIMEDKITPIWNVMGIINGTHADETIILGNHRDAWIIGGAGDPNSGTAILAELTKAFGELLKTGWKPRRNIVICSWDAEEYGIVGSTEWVEEYAPWLSGTAFSYINVDVAVNGGDPYADASPELHTVAKSLMRKIVYPAGSESTLYDKWQSLYQFQPETEGFGTLGSGSDYTAFPQYGIGALDFGMGGDQDAPVYHYHSNYDSFHWMQKFGDPGFQTHRSVGQYLSLLMYHLASDPLIPLDLDTFRKYVGYWNRDLLTSSINNQPDAGALQQFLRYNDLKAAETLFAQRARAFMDFINRSGFLGNARNVDIANGKLRDFQRPFANQGGLPGREFYRNVAYVPAADNGYSATTLPGPYEALKRGDREQARVEVQKVVRAINEAAEVLRLDEFVRV